MKTNFQNTKGIFLDLDDTLYEYKPCNEAGNRDALGFLSQELDVSLSEIEKIFKEARASVKQVLEKNLGFEVAASHSRLLYFQRVIERVTGGSRLTLTLKVEESFWAAYFKTMKLFPDAKTFLGEVKQRGKKVAIITDLAHRIQLKKIIQLGIYDLIDFVVSSEEVGQDKPHPAGIFLALSKTGLKPKETVFIGESEKDIEAAQRAGACPIIVHNKPPSEDIIFARDFADLCRMFQN